MLGKSDVLRMILNGGGKEMEEGKIVWPDWTVGGAERFLDWLYTEDYGFPYQRPISATNDGSEENGDSFNVDDELVAVIHGTTAPSKPMASHLDSEDYHDAEASAAEVANEGEEVTEGPLVGLQDLTWPGCHTPEAKSSQAEKFDNWVGHQLWNADQLDYETTFLAHAELYVMACRYMLEELKNLSWQRLRWILLRIGSPSAGSSVIGNLVTLISYVYKETSNEYGCTEPLRQLVTTFAALNLANFKGPKVDELMMSVELTDREYVLDLMLKATQKIDFLETRSAQSSVDQYSEAQLEALLQKRKSTKKGASLMEVAESSLANRIRRRRSLGYVSSSSSSA